MFLGQAHVLINCMCIKGKIYALEIFVLICSLWPSFLNDEFIVLVSYFVLWISAIPSGFSSSDDNRSAFAIPLLPPYKILHRDSVQSKPNFQGLITDGLHVLEKDREDLRDCKLCQETSFPRCMSPPSSTPVLAKSSSSEDELCRINWTKQQLAPYSGDEEICEAVDCLKPTSSNCFCNAAATSLTSDVQPEDIAAPLGISGTSLKRKAFPISSNCDLATVILRPNLDFEKMRVSRLCHDHICHNISIWYYVYACIIELTVLTVCNFWSAVIIVVWLLPGWIRDLKFSVATWLLMNRLVLN